MSFGHTLREARQTRRLTQEQLADDAEVSTRHLSCLESGKAQPSRDMVLVLASALDLPLRERNRLLNLAGFVAAYNEDGLDAQELEPVRTALAVMLEHHDPFPAFVFDYQWNMMMANAGAMKLATFLVPDNIPTNLVHALFAPDGLRQYLVNWEAVAATTLLHLRHTAEHDARLKPLIEAALAYPDPPQRYADATDQPFIPLHLRKDGVDIKLFTMLTTLGTPRYVVAQEIIIETYYPVDEATRAFFTP